MQAIPMILAAAADVFYANVGWIVALAIVVIGLAAFGLKDVLRLSLSRAWAVSSVCFTESMRKRVLLVTPLAILAVIIVSQFQKPIDELDAIRQTTKFCLFATGMLVVLTAILLACTNLPKEIENRVIFTIVTKPTTRLEIVLGKVMGFARVSATILLIMGVFTYGYLKIRAYGMQRELTQRLEAGVDPALRPTMEYYASAGLLNAKEYYSPASLEFFADLPADDKSVKWVSGAAEQSIAVPFEIPQVDLPATTDEASQLPAQLHVRATVYVRPTASAQPRQPVPSTAPVVSIPFLPGKEPTAAESQQATHEPSIYVEVLDPDFYTIITPQAITNDAPVPLKVGENKIDVVIPSSTLPTIYKLAGSDRPAKIHIGLRGVVPTFDYGVGADPMQLAYVTPDGRALPYKPTPHKTGQSLVAFRGRSGTHGQQLFGEKAQVQPVAVYSFRDQNVSDTGTVPVEVRSFVERGGDDEGEILTELTAQIRNRQTGQISGLVKLNPENGRTVYAHLPAEYLKGGNFDLLFKVATPGHWVSFGPASVGLVSADRYFGLNLFKSLLILWLLSVLVVAIAVFCSTFLSWPIAVVLTIVILMGRWGVIQLGDALTPGVGRQIATDFGLQGKAAESEVVSRSIEALSRGLQIITSVLPDIGSFAVTEDIERGVWIPASTIGQALLVLIMFGLPLIVLAYVIFRNKEVAP